MVGPGRRTREPVPNEITGNAVGAVDSRRWASMERLLLDAQTVQNFNFHESAVAASIWLALAAPASIVFVSEGAASGGGGGGGGGAWGVVFPVFTRRGSNAIVGARRDYGSQTMEENRIIPRSRNIVITEA